MDLENLEKINGVQKIAASFSCDLTLADAAGEEGAWDDG